ncbi:BlaI/MecI/CopY family transcriptional regulator [Rheinheimera sp. F8]|jgi:BlaI family transcriptional regulator, penicillinase repressor|uniref:BlaI/MecI/CopY family transcriptional regulator n=1 Tax=Rheinheimera tilapiae TaxID=875043 RepID=A0ABV6BFC8_9GAMM|nr:BlaI/MecI/CopY family transcriptional regulator [Rheinheimera sp. F8]ALZ75583.1 penicillinase repressor [Rheinheimera sp. F8]
MQPTAPELEILKLLWQLQPQTGRELHDQLADVLGWGYSSTRKTLERMVDKGLLVAELQGNQNSYSAQVTKVATLAALAQDFASRVLELKQPMPLAMFADSRLLTADDLQALEQQLQQLEQGGDSC